MPPPPPLPSRRPCSPYLSYSSRFSGFDNTSYAKLISLNYKVKVRVKTIGFLSARIQKSKSHLTPIKSFEFHLVSFWSSFSPIAKNLRILIVKLNSPLKVSIIVTVYDMSVGACMEVKGQPSLLPLWIKLRWSGFRWQRLVTLSYLKSYNFSYLSRILQALGFTMVIFK